MDNKTVVYLLKRNIKELELITDGLEEMTEYPSAIILLAQKKTEEILRCVNQLSTAKSTSSSDTLLVTSENTSASNENLPQEIIPTIEDYVMEVDDEKIEIKIERTENELETQVLLEDESVDVSLNSEELVDKDEDFEQISTSFENRQEDGTIDTETDIATIYTHTAEQNSSVEPSQTNSPAENTSVVKNEQQNGAAITHTAQNRMVDAHVNGKVADIRQAISLGDRFLFQRKLFNGNGEEMNKVLLKLNNFNNFDEASQFLRSNYNWNEEDEVVESFYQALKRRL